MRRLRSKNSGEKGGTGTGGGGVPDPADLEVGVDVGEADGGGVLDGAVRLAPALHRRHFVPPASASASAPAAARCVAFGVGGWLFVRDGFAKTGAGVTVRVTCERGEGGDVIMGESRVLFGKLAWRWRASFRVIDGVSSRALRVGAEGSRNSVGSSEYCSRLRWNPLSTRKFVLLVNCSYTCACARLLVLPP